MRREAAGGLWCDSHAAARAEGLWALPGAPAAFSGCLEGGAHPRLESITAPSPLAGESGPHRKGWRPQQTQPTAAEPRSSGGAGAGAGARQAQGAFSEGRGIERGPNFARGSARQTQGLMRGAKAPTRSANGPGKLEGRCRVRRAKSEGRGLSPPHARIGHSTAQTKSHKNQLRFHRAPSHAPAISRPQPPDSNREF